MRPQMVKVSPTPPQRFTTTPRKDASPLFAELEIGAKEHKVKINIVCDTKNTPLEFQTTAKVVDTKTKSEYYKSGGKEYARQWAQITVPLTDGEWNYDYTVTFLRPDPRDPANAATKDALYYTSGTLMKGTIDLNGKTYSAALHDTTASGDFRGMEGATSNVLLLIDRNGNGVYDKRGESYDTALPFKIEGQTFEIKSMNPSGTKFEIVPSDKSVPEFPAPPDLRNGKFAPPLVLKSLDGKRIDFPADYKGKKVLLYFWASWCGDCQRELPNLLKAYKQYHPQGVEILGVSLDKPNNLQGLVTYLKSNGMTWMQTYDGKMWETNAVYQYLVGEIPGAFLVDASSGTILASGEDLLGARLPKTLALYTTKRP